MMNFKNALKKYSERIDNPRTEYDWITRDPEQVEAFLADEKCAFIPKKDLFLSLLHGLTLITDPDQIKKMNREIRLPVLDQLSRNCLRAIHFWEKRK